MVIVKYSGWISSNTDTAAKFITGITETNGTIASISDTPFIDTIVGNETGDNSIIAPTTAAVVNYISSTLTNWTGNTAIESVGTITTGTWNASNISTAKIGLTNETLSTDLIPELAASKITSGVFEAS